MNPTLQALLSGLHDDLSPEHLADLRKSGITDTSIKEQSFRSVPPGMAGKLIGFDVPGVTSWMLLPFTSPAGGYMDYVRVRVFPPQPGKDGKGTMKYLQRSGAAPHVYFVRSVLDRVLTGAEPLWMVEGEKKAVAVAQLGLPAVGFCGVEGWHLKGSRELLSDFGAIRLDGRVVELLPDGDYQTNPDVHRAVNRFSAALTARGAAPRVRLLPDKATA